MENKSLALFQVFKITYLMIGLICLMALENGLKESRKSKIPLVNYLYRWYTFYNIR